MSEPSATIPDRPPRIRSRVSNGSSRLPDTDGRSTTARRYRDLAMAYADELGGEANLTETERALVRQAAAMVVRSEGMQARIVRGEAVDDEELTRLCNGVTRILNSLRRKARPVAKIPLRDRLRGSAAA